MENNETITVGMDFGASRIKAVYEDDKEQGSNKFKDIVFPNKYLVGDNNNGSGYKVDRCEYVNKIGCDNGTSNFTNVKINYNYLDDIILVIAADITKQLNIENEINLDIHTLLPPQQFLEIREAFRQKLYNFGTIEGFVDGKKVKCTIKNVKIACEGVAQFLAMNRASIADYKRATLIDAGSSTIDLVNLKKTGDKWSISGAITIHEVSGSLIVKAITTKIKKEFVGIMIDPTELEQDLYFYVGDEKHEIVEYIDGANDVIATLANPLREFYKGGKLLVSGGAGELLMSSDVFLEICKNTCKATPELLDEYTRTYGNAKGAYKS